MSRHVASGAPPGPTDCAARFPGDDLGASTATSTASQLAVMERPTPSFRPSLLGFPYDTSVQS